METDDSLRFYFTNDKNIESEEISDIFLDLDKKLKYVHQQGAYVHNLNSDNIKYSGTGFNFSKTSVFRGLNEDLKKENIVALAKLNLGTQVSIASGFSDFTAISTESIMANFSMMEMTLSSGFPNDEYLKMVFEKGVVDVYYHEYLGGLDIAKEGASSRDRGLSKSLSTEAGRALGAREEEDSAFINVIFYPVIIAVALLLIAVLIVLI